MFFINVIKIVFVLGFLVFIHEGGHCIIAKLCKVKVNEFSIGFGPMLLKKQGKETLYSLRAIPLGGYVNMEGESELSDIEGSFSNAKLWKRIAIVSAGALVNIIFGIIVFFILASILQKNIFYGLQSTGNFLSSIFEGLKLLFSGNVGINDMVGPVGLSSVVSSTQGIGEFVYILAVISLSLGITNLLPIPALDGFKIILLIIEGIRKKPIKEDLELKLQLLGFACLITLSVIVTYNDIIKLI